MTEGNFTDYVKIYAASGKGGAGSMHLHREKLYPKEVPMVVMAVGEGILSLGVISTSGRLSTLNFRSIL